MVDLHRAGRRISDLAHEFGISHWAISRWIKQADRDTGHGDGGRAAAGRAGQHTCEVEGALCTHSDVLEAAVVAWPDEDELIKPKAFVVLKSPDKVCEELAQALQEHVKAALAPYKYPRWIEFRTELPKTATGKIQRFKLRAERT